MHVRRPFLAVLAGWLFAAGVAAAQVVAPPPPERYDAQVRYRLRSVGEQRITAFDALAKHLASVGFTHADPKAFELELLDPAAETATGSLPSANVPKLFDNPAVITAVLTPAGSKLLDDPKKPVPVRIELVGGLGKTEQRLLHEQAADHLGKLGFVPAVAYDHRGFTRLQGMIPAGAVGSLLKDLRTLPPGWFIGGADRSALPSPLKLTVPVRVVEVLPDRPAAPEPVNPPASGKLSQDVAAVVADAAAADKPLVVEVMIEEIVSELDLRGRLRTALPGAGVEGFAGNTVTLRLPRAALLQKVVEFPNVRHVRLPRVANSTARPAAGAKANDFVAWSGVGRLHALGYTGAGAVVAVVAADFTGAEVVKGTDSPRLTLGGSPLPAGSRLIDLTGEVSPTLEAAPSDPLRQGDGTAVAQAVHAAAPGAALFLVRVDPARYHQLISVARAVSGQPFLTTAMTTRSEEMTVRAAILTSRRKGATAELQLALADLRDDPKVVQRREAAAAAMKQLQADEVEFDRQLNRFLALKAGLEALRGASVVVNTLVWESGYPLDGQSELSREIEAITGVEAGRAAFRAAKKAAVPGWVQAGGEAVGSVWAGPFLDADRNGVMEFAPATTAVPPSRWTRELNFLGYKPAGGQPTLTLPAGTKLRLTAQWREPHIRDLILPAEPTYPIVIRLYRQLDPSGKTTSSDDLVEVTRSVGEIARLMKTPGSGVYEAVLETTIAADGVYAVRLERGPDLSDLPQTARLEAEIRPRLLAEVTDPAQAAKGRVVFDTYSTQNAGVGVPGDSPAALAVGNADVSGGKVTPLSLTGVGPGVALGAKPEVFVPGVVTVSGIAVAGTGVSAGYAAGVAASLWGLGIRTPDLLPAVGLKPGSSLVLPNEWLEYQRPRRVQTSR